MKSLVIEATYENGVLKPASPLPLKESAKVLVTVQLRQEPRVVTSEEAEFIVRRSQGMLRWLDRRVEVLHRIAEDPEFDLLER
jgi:predicted DNA-binding antitoxin AbrB/MazE fold protein